MSRKNWYVPHPLFQYAEDVKAIARKADLCIVDANVVPEDERVDEVEKPPKLKKLGADKADAPATAEEQA